SGFQKFKELEILRIDAFITPNRYIKEGYHTDVKILAKSSRMDKFKPCMINGAQNIANVSIGSYQDHSITYWTPDDHRQLLTAPRRIKNQMLNFTEETAQAIIENYINYRLSLYTEEEYKTNQDAIHARINYTPPEPETHTEAEPLPQMDATATVQALQQARETARTEEIPEPDGQDTETEPQQTDQPESDRAPDALDTEQDTNRQDDAEEEATATAPTTEPETEPVTVYCHGTGSGQINLF
ncbi:MAG: hypothetical protein ABIF11_11690, partial [Nitrospirota bacterium]